MTLTPSDCRIDQHEQRDRLPSALALAQSRYRLIGGWERAYMRDEAFAICFAREAAATLPRFKGTDLAGIYAVMDWLRLQLLQDQRVPEWTFSATG